MLNEGRINGKMMASEDTPSSDFKKSLLWFIFWLAIYLLFFNDDGAGSLVVNGMIILELAVCVAIIRYGLGIIISLLSYSPLIRNWEKLQQRE